jgi:hypothetical protein
LTQEEAGSYAVQLNQKRSNDYWKNKFLTHCRYSPPWTPPEGHRPEFDQTHRFIDSSIVGEQYEKIEMPIPWLAPGESKQFFIPLVISPDFRISKNQHLPSNATVYPGGTCEHNGWDHMYLYYGGFTTLTGDILCEESGGGLNYCGATDVETITNPNPPY